MVQNIFIKYRIISFIISIVQYKYIVGERIDEEYVKDQEKKLLKLMLAYFFSYADFISRIGINYDEIKNELQQKSKWSKGSIISRIQYLKKLDIPLDSTYARQNYSKLFDASFRHFGNWEKAITAAGFNYDEIRKTEKRNREIVVAELFAILKREKKLNDQFLQKHYPKTRDAAFIHFDNLEDAVSGGADLDYNKIRLTEKWSTEKLDNIILDFYKKEMPLYKKYIQDNHPKVYNAAIRYRGSWGDAVEKVGLDYSEISQRLTSKIIAKRITEKEIKKIEKEKRNL